MNKINSHKIKFSFKSPYDNQVIQIRETNGGSLYTVKFSPFVNIKPISLEQARGILFKHGKGDFAEVIFPLEGPNG